MKAYELLDSKEKWTQNRLAANVMSQTCFPHDSEATCWCALGAITKCYPPLPDDTSYDCFSDYSAAVRKIHGSIDKLGYDTVASWNDAKERTYEDVVSLLLELDL